MTTLMTTQRAYEQGCVDGAKRMADIAIEHFKKHDQGKSRSKFKSAIERVMFLKNNVDMEAARNGYACIRKNNGFLRGVFVGAALSLLTLMMALYAITALNTWGWL